MTLGTAAAGPFPIRQCAAKDTSRRRLPLSIAFH